MAPGSLSPVYLPDLAKCFAGDVMLPSWDDLLEALLSHDTKRSEFAVEVLSGERPKRVLSKSIPTFSSTSGNSKTAFDTTIATVPPSDSLYNIDEIKSDALWLSKQTGLEELEALRVVFLDWQYRPESRLQEGLSVAEIASLRDALGSEYLDRQTQSLAGARPRDDSIFDGQNARRGRLILQYLRQQVTVIRIHKELLDMSLLPAEAKIASSHLQNLVTEVPQNGAGIANQGIADPYIKAIQLQLEMLRTDREWDLEVPEIITAQEASQTTRLQTIAEILEILLLKARSLPGRASTTDLFAWLHFMQSEDFFSTFTSELEEQQLEIERIQLSASLITATMFALASSISSLTTTGLSNSLLRQTDSVEFFFDPLAASELHELVMVQAKHNNVQAGPAVLSWAIILQQIRTLASQAKEYRENHYASRIGESVATFDAATGRRGSSGSTASLQQSIFEDVWDKIANPNEQIDPADWLLDCAMAGLQIFEYIVHLRKHIDSPTTMLSAYKLQTLQELVAVSVTFLGYTTESVSAQLALMSTSQTQSTGPLLFDPSLELLQNSDLEEGFFNTAALRFPYEPLPFLKFSKALARTNVCEDGRHYVEFRMKCLSTFTQTATDDVDFNTIREDENANLVVLNTTINMLNLSQSQTLMLENTTPGSVMNSLIPAETIGQVISYSFPPVIRWQHSFSGFAYLGKLVELYHLRLVSTALSQVDSPEEVVAEIISLAATLLHTITGNIVPDGTSGPQQHCVRVLDELSTHMAPGTDFAYCIFEILEQELQSFRRRSAATFDCRVLVSCLDFAVAFTKIRPAQVWSSINRTSLFSHHSGVGLMLPLISTIEMLLCSYDFLEKCSQLYQTLIESAVTRSCPDTSMGRRSGREPTISPSLVLRVQGPLLFAITEAMFNVFQQIQDWTFVSREQFARINSRIAKSFTDILCFTFNFGESVGSTLDINNAFSQAANFLVSAFRSDRIDDLPAIPIVRYLFAAGCGNERTTKSGAGDGSNLNSMLSLTITLIRLGMLRNLPLSVIEAQVFNGLPAVARILQLYPSHRPLCLTLFQSTLTYVDQHQPSSLLRHFGSAPCLDLVHLLKHIDQLSQTSQSRDEVWRLLSLLVKSTQQWVGTLILTGSLPDDSRKLKGQDRPLRSLRGKTFLQTVVEELGDVAALSPVVALSMLQFVLQAQSCWPWVTDDLKSSTHFFSKLVNYITKSRNLHKDDEMDQSLQNAIASHVTDLATTHLHYSTVNRDKSAIRTFAPLLEWLAANAIDVSSYNASLQTNLRKNFSAKYCGLAVTNIRRTGLIERRYGPNFFYDVDFGTRLFLHDPYWDGGQSRTPSQSFSAEFRRANNNLSLVDSELVLLRSLHHFCVEHCKLFVREREDQVTLAHIVRHCLQANARVFSPEPFFETLLQTRADLSLSLLRQLLSADAKGSSLSSLLEPAWIALRAQNRSYDEAIVHDDLVYWRSMLSILVMIVQYHDTRTPKPTKLPQTSASMVVLDPANVVFLEMATTIVAEGFKTVVSTLQEQQLGTPGAEAEGSNHVGIRDVLLLLTLFQAILRLPLLAQFSAELSERLISSGVISSCLLLYSWSHLLRDPESSDQADYADLSIQFLVSLSSLPLVAEELAVEGVLSRVSTSKTTESLQRARGGVSHIDQRPRCGLLYRIWAGGLLPLCLNLLHAVGGVIAAEISGFLNQFPNQLVRASTSFMTGTQARREGTDVLTFLKANESSTLALISHILSSYRDAGASVAVDPSALSPLSGYDEHRKAIIEDLNSNLALEPLERERLTIATNDRELEWQKSANGDILDAKIVRETRIALAALRREEDYDEK
ncbi:uncharacterized protein A1O9_12672 [Exophiala aquamarina CBS 119918]|uniref:Nucleoporin NUP188 n=1 Tax=Exophiala aquamarina CBS 119918 TaxID=1182545 RepID=A0A072NVB8_9EURO|nr:uncharacterized protein A1O9_12672 [Exophiala aquamarina CBS 119918]KEF51322.1 hypothetical protein A1O9_12672 [Exophiala aquamarina CBS 119918]